MQQIVSITSQGQITIPALMRRALDLEECKKASVQIDKRRIIIEPIPDILKLGGFLKDKAVKGKSISEIMKLEKEARPKAIVRESLLKK